MDTFMLEATDDSPLVYLDKKGGKMLLRGRSLMEDALPFQRPIIEWLRNYMASPNPVNIFEIDLEYINSASHQMLLEIIGELNKYYILGHSFEIIWIFHRDDEYMAGIAQELKEMYDIPIKEVELV
jgi:hypothetical protein